MVQNNIEKKYVIYKRRPLAEASGLLASGLIRHHWT